MGNRASNVASPSKVYSSRRRSPEMRRQVTRAPREVEEVEFRAPRRAAVSRRSSKTKSALPRDPSTGRYLPRGQRAGAPRAAKRAGSPRRRVSVEVFATSQSDVRADAEIERTIRGRRSPRAADINAAPSSLPRRAGSRAASPRQVAFDEFGRSRQRSYSPAVEVEVEEPQRAVRATRAQMEPTARGSPILRSSYTRCEAGAEEPQVEQPRSRAAPRRQQVTQLPVSRRDYASPSLATQAPRAQRVEQESEDPQVMIGPSTSRRMRKMATADVSLDAPSAPTSALPPAERMSFAAQTAAATANPPQPSLMATKAPAAAGNPTELLFSYLNAA